MRTDDVAISAASSILDACAARVAFMGKRYPAELAKARAAAVRVNDETMFPDMKKVGEQRAVDAKSGLRNTGALAGALPKARLVEYAGAGHFPYLDAPQRFTQDVVGFLRD